MKRPEGGAGRQRSRRAPRAPPFPPHAAAVALGPGPLPAAQDDTGHRPVHKGGRAGSPWEHTPRRQGQFSIGYVQEAADRCSSLTLMLLSPIDTHILRRGKQTNEKPNTAQSKSANRSVSQTRPGCPS